MDAKELKLGNWVLNESDVPCRVIGLGINEDKKQVVTVDFEGKWDGEFYIEYTEGDKERGLELVKPVPITNDMLSRNGFSLVDYHEEDTFHDFLLDAEDGIVRCNQYETYYEVQGYTRYVDEGSMTEYSTVRYVHELQNFMGHIGIEHFDL